MFVTIDELAIRFDVILLDEVRMGSQCAPAGTPISIAFAVDRAAERISWSRWLRRGRRRSRRSS